MDFKKKLLIILILIAIGVWGYNFYQLRRNVEAEQVVVPGLHQISAADTSLDLQPYIYQPGQKDPFRHWLFVEEKTTVAKPEKTKLPPIPKQLPPAFVLQGIMGDKTSPRAILVDQAGKSYISKVGDMVQGMKILKIEKNKVTFEFMGSEVSIFSGKK
jgi:type II secretory pathway component PulC